MSDKVDNTRGPQGLPPPQKKTITKKTSVVSTEEADKLIKQKLAQGAKVIQQDGKILIQSQAKPMFAKAQEHLKPTTAAETKGGTPAEGAMKQQGTTRIETRAEMSQVQAAKTATAGRLGDTPVLPKALITKPDKALINSFLAKFGENSQVKALLADEGQLAQRAEKAFTTVMNGRGAGILGTTPEERKFLLLLLLLELGYQNKEINRAETKMGQKLREGSTQIQNDQSKIEIIATKTQGMLNYAQKMQDADAKMKEDAKAAAKEIWKNINNIRDIKATEELQAAQKESRDANAATARLFGPSPPRSATDVAAARDAYRNAATATPPPSQAELTRLRDAYIDVAGERAVLDNEATGEPPVGTAQQRSVNEAGFGSRAATARTNANNATANLRREEAEFRETTSGTARMQAAIDHPNWPPGAVFAYGRARSEAMLARTRVGGDLADRFDRLNDKASRTDAEQQELDALVRDNPDLAEYASASRMSARIERIANDEERFNSSDRPGSAEGHTDWAAVDRELQEYERAIQPDHANGLVDFPAQPPPRDNSPAARHGALETRLAAAEDRLDSHRAGADGSGTASADLRATRAAERAASSEMDMSAGELRRANSDREELDRREADVTLRLGQTIPRPSPEEATRLRNELAEIRRAKGPADRRVEAATARHTTACREYTRLRDGNTMMRRSREEDRPTAAQQRELSERGATLARANSTLGAAETRYNDASEARADFTRLSEIDTQRATLAATPGNEAAIADLDAERAAIVQRRVPSGSTETAARDAAETEYRNASTAVGEARRAQATAETNYNSTLEQVGARPPAPGPLADGAPRTGYARVPEGDGGRRFGVPRPTERFTDGRTMLDEAGRASASAHSDYWALNPDTRPTTTVPRLDGRNYTEESFAAEFGRPPQVTNEAGERVPLTIGTPARAPTDAELANPFSIENPDDRARVLNYSRREASAKAQVIDSQVSEAQDYARRTNREHWNEADARAVGAAHRRAAVAEDNLYAQIPPSERGPDFPQNVPYETGDSPRARAVQEWYAARHDSDVAELEGTARSYSPPKDITVARAEIDRLYGSPTSTPPGGLRGARAAATDPDAIATADRAISDSNARRRAESPAPRIDPNPPVFDANKQEVEGPGFWRAIAINMSKFETWEHAGYLLVHGDESKGQLGMGGVALRYADTLINSFTQIAGRDIQEFDALFADMRQELARANAMTSSDWARTLAAMERTLKSMNR